MRMYPTAILLIFVAAYCSITAFQCGSAEMTTAKLAIQQKQYDKAEEALVKTLVKNDKDEDAWFTLGEVRYELKKYREMNEAFNRALALSDLHKGEIHHYKLDVWSKQFNAGVDAYNMGRSEPSKYDEAIEKLALASSILPDSVHTYRALALAHYAKKDYPKAISALESALAGKPEFTDGGRLLGQIHYTIGEERRAAGDEAAALASFTKAADMYEMVYKNDPKSSENIQDLIDALSRSKQEEKVLSLTRGCIDADPNNRVCRFAYGVYLLQRTSFTEAIDELKKVREIDPNATDQLWKDVTYNLGVGYLNWGVAMKAEADKEAEAESKVKKSKDIKPDLSYKEKFKAAAPYLEEAVTQRKDDADLWQRLGQLYANLNMVEKSKAAYDEFDRLTKGQ